MTSNPTTTMIGDAHGALTLSIAVGGRPSLVQASAATSDVRAGTTPAEALSSPLLLVARISSGDPPALSLGEPLGAEQGVDRVLIRLEDPDLNDLPAGDPVDVRTADVDDPAGLLEPLMQEQRHALPAGERVGGSDSTSPSSASATALSM